MADLNKYGELIEEKEQSRNRYLCPGCGERATAKDGDFCNECDRFVHRQCQKMQGESYCCPICDKKLRTVPKGCFISTAAAASLGLPDDCMELNTLRRFRDTYMTQSPDLRREVAHYYEIAPIIVESILSLPSAPTIWQNLWQMYLAPAIAAIKSGECAEAHRIYRAMVVYVSCRFGDSRKVCS